jgi:hypothetical protein
VLAATYPGANAVGVAYEFIDKASPVARGGYKMTMTTMARRN